MTQRVTHSARHASLAIAVVSLALIGLLFVRAHAQETGEAVVALPPGAARADMREERRATIEENREVRRELTQEQQAEIQALYESGASPERVQAAIDANRAEMRTMFGEQRGARVEERLQVREQARTMLAEQRERIQARIMERRQDMEQRRATYTARLGAAVQARVGEAAQGVAQGMTNALMNLEQVAIRVQARIEAHAAEGIATADAQAAFADVDALVASAQEDIAAFQELAQQAALSEDPKADVKAVREAATTSKESIKLVHQALADTVQELKSALELRDTGSEYENGTGNADTANAEE